MSKLFQINPLQVDESRPFWDIEATTFHMGHQFDTSLEAILVTHQVPLLEQIYSKNPKISTIFSSKLINTIHFHSNFFLRETPSGEPCGICARTFMHLHKMCIKRLCSLPRIVRKNKKQNASQNKYDAITQLASIWQLYSIKKACIHRHTTRHPQIPVNIEQRHSNGTNIFI